MAVYRNPKTTKKEEAVTEREPIMKDASQEVTDEAMELLARLMNDSPTLVKLHDTTWEIRSLKPGVQWLISEEACKIVKQENASMGDVLKEFANNISSVCRIITLALLNDRRAKNPKHKDYVKIYDMLMWGDYEVRDWATILFEILRLVDVDFFFASTDVITTLRQMTLTRKQTRKEQRLSTAAQSGVR